MKKREIAQFRYYQMEEDEIVLALIGRGMDSRIWKRCRLFALSQLFRNWDLLRRKRRCYIRRKNLSV